MISLGSQDNNHDKSKSNKLLKR